ncbi:uncharacterized protein LOC119102214 [Pollicipes pollicipes]|uniref:uncharacterized protein LOC119102214 n=1 Tax=Pollicipes pollicipes TaxID=41117 RepID=UPI0018856635|nr:uncharacterized protein LOC119102214 [Pollicipes pollicipes]
MDLKLSLLCLVVISTSAGMTLQDPYIHDLPEDQLAVETGGQPTIVEAPFDRTPTARVPGPAAADAVVFDREGGDEEPQQLLFTAPGGYGPAGAGGPWRVAGGPAVLLLQPIVLPLSLAQTKTADPEQQLDYYGAASSRRRRQPLTLAQLLRQVYGL